MKSMKNIIASFFASWKSLYPTMKFIFLVQFIFLLGIASSVFFQNLDANGHLVIFRVTFSSIMGFLLETTSKQIVSCNSKSITLRNRLVGLITIIITIVIVISAILNTDINNPSVILLKNTLSSCIGFLISATKNCAYDS